MNRFFLRLLSVLFLLVLLGFSVNSYSAAPGHWRVLETWSTVDVLDIEKRTTFSSRTEPKTVRTVTVSYTHLTLPTTD